MSNRDKSGIYGADIAWWGDGLWWLIGEGRFSWAIVRSDTSYEMAKKLKERGIEVILQFPDVFNKWPPPDPGQLGKEYAAHATPYEPTSDLIVLDNEPNLYPDRAGNWFAEEFTRWYRALAASFRYHDRRCHWKLVFPGMCCAPDRNIDYWLHISKENVLESDVLGVHAYWQDASQLDHIDFGGQWKRYYRKYPASEQLILEYGNSNPEAGDEEKCVEYPEYVSTLPDCVLCACLFILGGTPQWGHFHLTPAQAQALGEVP